MHFCGEKKSSGSVDAVNGYKNSNITFDRFHVIKTINDAVDRVRRSEQKDFPQLKKSRYVWLKNQGNHTARQREIYDELKDSTLKTARAYRIKEMLQRLYEQPTEGAEDHLKRWYFWATHSRLEPIIKAAKTIKAHWEGVMRWFKSGLNNGFMEGINSLVQAAKARARGYRSARKMKTMIYLIASKVHPTKAYLVSWSPKILSLKNSMSLYP
jgi:transposase